MAEQFVGYSVVVTLKSPPNCRVQGVVADVVGHRLSLQNVTLLWNNQNVPVYHIEASGIADLYLLPQERSIRTDISAPNAQQDTSLRSEPPLQQHQQQQQHSNNLHEAQPQENKQSFIDPAILSYQKPPSQRNGLVDITQAPQKALPVQSPVMIGGHELPAPSGSLQPLPITTAPESIAAATLTAPFNALGLKSPDENLGDKSSLHRVIGEGDVHLGPQAPSETTIKYTAKRSRRGVRGKLQNEAEAETIEPQNNKLSTGATESSPTSNGWRQTAFVEPALGPTSQSTRRLSVRHKRRYKRHPEEQNGWATEDATDIQEMGDFDFQSNLSKFDKRRIFDQIRNDDTTADEDRLVSFNRRARPGTNGGRNLHYTENVLDPLPEFKTQWDGTILETDYEYPDESRFENERNPSRARSRASIPRSRNGSGALSASISSPPVGLFTKGQFISARTASPRPSQRQAASPRATPSGSVAGFLQIVPTSRRCPSVSPLQMLEVEQLSISELGLTEDIITENAGRGIAEAVISLTGLQRSSTVLIFTGNHKTGARAISAARHLRNHNYRVTVCILGLDHDSEFSDSFRRQVDIFKKAGGKTLRWKEVSTMLSTAEYSPGLVVDALFGMHVAFDDLRTDDQQTAFEIISWTNRSGIGVVCVDIPAGLSASTGEPTFMQGAGLAINATFIVCLGAPKIGIINALSAGRGESWQIAAVDVGISQTAWRKYGARKRYGVEFGDKWVVPLRFQAASPS
ncbi:enhancer of mRNA decapping [Ophidiomyces ophidiicola]|nr:enhancer of mRNA decapping [Ophidiomyces ophidiicola]